MRMWCIQIIDAIFRGQMYDLLDLYEVPYNLKRPVVCFDEKPKQILGDKRIAIPMRPGSSERYDSVSPNQKKWAGNLNSCMGMKIPVGNYRRLPDDPSTWILTVQRCEDGNRLSLIALYTGQCTVHAFQARIVWISPPLYTTQPRYCLG